jgi:UDP-galactopyranose mutase
MIQKFGYGIVRHFMLPYNLKFWRQHPKDLICDWLDGRIPLPSLQESVSGAFEKSGKQWGYNWQFWYPKTGGISVLPRAFVNKIKKINYSHKVKKIDIKNKVVIFDNSFCDKFDYLVSTIPLPELERIIYPIPEKVKKAIRKLRYLSILNLNLGISKNHFDKHWIYFPDKRLTFYRLGFFSNFSVNLAPPGNASLYTEVSYPQNNAHINKRYLIQKIKRDLIKVDIISNTGQISTSLVNEIKYGYIIYDNEYNMARKSIIEFLEKNKIFSIGRFGNWRYLSMEESIIDGKIAAESLN